MKGIYLTPEGKQEIEAKIKELRTKGQVPIITLEAILEIATILPVEESWKNIAHSTTVSFYELDFPKGIIIQPKQ
jgi:hypothetical protein